MRDKDLESYWHDPTNWTRFGFYRCIEDPRWWVRKRDPGIGYTINVAHPSAIVSLVTLVSVCLVPLAFDILEEPGRSGLRMLLSMIVPIAVVVGIGAWLTIRDS